MQGLSLIPNNVRQVTQEKVNYYLEAVKLYYYNCILYNQFDKLVEERNVLMQRLNRSYQANKNQDSSQQAQSEMQYSKKKKVRRCANQIERTYACKYPGCNKTYGTEGSLLQHMRLKHEEFMKTNQPKMKSAILNPKELIQQQMQKQEQEMISRRSIDDLL